MKKDPSDPVWKKIESMSPEERLKCEQDLRHYYNNYVKRHSDPVLDEKQFEALQDHWKLVRAGKMIAKPSEKNVFNYPLTYDEVYLKKQ